MLRNLRAHCICSHIVGEWAVVWQFPEKDWKAVAEVVSVEFRSGSVQLRELLTPDLEDSVHAPLEASQVCLW